MKYLNKEQSYLLLELCIDYSLFICISIDTKCRIQNYAVFTIIDAFLQMIDIT